MDGHEAITACVDDSIEGPGVSLLIAGLRDARQGYEHNAQAINFALMRRVMWPKEERG